MQLHLTAMRETLPELLKKMKEVAQSAGLEKVVMWDFPRDLDGMVENSRERKMRTLQFHWGGVRFFL